MHRYAGTRNLKLPTEPGDLQKCIAKACRRWKFTRWAGQQLGLHNTASERISGMWKVTRASAALRPRLQLRLRRRNQIATWWRYIVALDAGRRMRDAIFEYERTKVPCSVVRIQSWWRSTVANRTFRQFIRAVLVVQRALKVFRARVEVFHRSRMQQYLQRTMFEKNIARIGMQTFPADLLHADTRQKRPASRSRRSRLHEDQLQQERAVQTLLTQRCQSAIAATLTTQGVAMARARKLAADLAPKMVAVWQTDAPRSCDRVAATAAQGRRAAALSRGRPSRLTADAVELEADSVAPKTKSVTLVRYSAQEAARRARELQRNRDLSQQRTRIKEWKAALVEVFAGNPESPVEAYETLMQQFVSDRPKPTVLPSILQTDARLQAFVRALESTIGGAPTMEVRVGHSRPRSAY